MKKLLNLIEKDNRLIIERAEGVTDEDLAECQSIEEALEYQLCNGWYIIDSREIGAFTDGLLISQDLNRDENGDLISLGYVYWDDAHEVRDALESLIRHGTVYFIKY